MPATPALAESRPLLRTPLLVRQDRDEAASFAVLPAPDPPDRPIWPGLSSSGDRVGSARARADAALATLVELLVGAAHAPFGIAAQLLRAALGWSQTASCAGLRVDPTVTAQMPVPLLERLGFISARADGECIIPIEVRRGVWTPSS